MEDEEEDVSNYWIALLRTNNSGTLKGNSSSHSVENWLWQSVWACRETDSGISCCVEIFIIYRVSQEERT
jgi:hypothetical protein